MLENSCSILLSEGPLGISVSTIAYYAHLIPAALGLFIGTYALYKTKFSNLSLSFFLFIVSFTLWLIGDLFPWTSTNYSLIQFTWSWLDYVNVVFFVFGAYFFGMLARGRLTNIEKFLFIAVTLPALWISATGNSVFEFLQPWCEVIENSVITNYKLFAEIATVLMMFISLIIAWRDSNKGKKIQLTVVFSSIILFFAVFSATEYVATITDVYEINLYGLFVLPIFLIAMVFSITNLHVFKLRNLGTQLLVAILIILVASQFLFLEGSTDRTLNLLTLGLSILFAFLLLKNAGKEEEQLEKIQNLAGQLKDANEKLKALDKQKTEFLSFASHQLRSPVTAIKGYASMIMEGTFGEMGREAKNAVEIIFQSAKKLTVVIEDYLNVSRIELGTMKYDFAETDLKQLVENAAATLKPIADAHNLQLTTEIDGSKNYKLNIDSGKISQAVSNLIDNSIKYTKTGSINVKLLNLGGKMRLEIKDTGVGIDKETMERLFQKFSRAHDATHMNSEGTGLGLYVAKQLVEAHGGKLWGESEGKGKGTTFIIELPIKK